MVLHLVEHQMQLDDETTAIQLHEMLTRHGVQLSLRTIMRSRQQLGWTFRGSAYCQLIRNANKVKRLEWANQNISNDFSDVIWSDESSIQLETHRRHCYRKIGSPPTPKPRAKHPVKVHVWAGISAQGATKICIFEGIMTAENYACILEQYLIPFIRQTFPSTIPRFMQDNDPKHTSRLLQDFFLANNINWWKTPPESPDLNPIENLWHELKEDLRARVKPRTKSELIDGIESFWATVNIDKCCKYIKHLKKVIPKVIELEGAATGY